MSKFEILTSKIVEKVLCRARAKGKRLRKGRQSDDERTSLLINKAKKKSRSLLNGVLACSLTLRALRALRACCVHVLYVLACLACFIKWRA